MIIGIAATALTFTALIISIVSYFLYYQRKSEDLLKLARLSFYTSAVLIVLQSAMLMWGILTHHFEWSYVFSYSSRDLTLYYLISTFWAGQEGTFLLWTLMGSLYGLFIIRKKEEDEALVMSFMGLVQAFIVMILIKKNPFSFVWQINPSVFAPGVIPPDGNGLNPLLQDPWMTIHPPILFAGYSATMILFAFAMAALIRKNYSDWIKPAYPYVLFASTMLGTGIILGAYWAYTTLGWGGFWGWDPVENSSLIPWITSLALIHGIVIQRTQGGVKKTNIFLALITFILVLYGSFLTRSGVLTDFSVHSFGSSELNLYLTGFVVLFLAISLLTFLFRINEVKSEKVQTELFSRESFILFGVLVLGIFAILTFIGTSSPIISGLFGKASNVSTDYYNTLAGPLAVLMGLLIALAPRLTWKRNNGEKLQQLLWHLSGAIVLGIVSFFLGIRDIMPLLITITAFFMILVNGEIIFRMVSRKNYKFGGYLTHLGLGLMLIGIITSSVYDSSKRVTLPMDTPIHIMGHEVEYNGKVPSPDGKDKVMLKINNKREIAKFYWSDYSRAYMVGPAVQNTFLRDFYVSPIQIIPPEKSWSNAREVELKKGSKISFGDYQLKFLKYDMGNHGMQSGDIHLAAEIAVFDKAGADLGIIKPAMVMRGQKKEIIPAELPDKKQKAMIKGINVETGSLTIAVSGGNDSKDIYAGKELLAVEISVKPLISVLWLGTILLVIGFILTTYQYRRKKALKTA